MRAETMSVQRDAMGNLSGRYGSGDPTAPWVMVGSHIDSVYDAGNYDGALGIMIGIELVALLRARGRRLPFGIEIIAFGDEEGSRFPDSMMCSRAVAGLLPHAALQTTDSDGVSVAEALTAFDCDPTRIAAVARPPGSVLAYIEPHIEQGSVLDMEDLPIGIVTGIAAQLRIKARFTGVAGHAGTSPMRGRHDALAAASEGILAVERICSVAHDVVGTVGHVATSTHEYNVIVGEAELSIDVRAGTDAIRDDVAASIRAALEEIARRRRLVVNFDTVQRLPATQCDPCLMNVMAESAQHAGLLSPLHLVSGAGHDAIAMAQLAPTAMLFIRCAGGVSHNPLESVAVSDVDVAISVLAEAIMRLGVTVDEE
jgi:allantoate deiminase